MPSQTDTASAEKRRRKPRRIPLHQTIRGIIRDPLTTFEEVSMRARGEMVRIDLGPFRPYLVTHPEHVQHVLKDNASNYGRTGMFWQPLRRIFGDGILVDTPNWEPSRRRLQPLFAARKVGSIVDRLADAVNDAVEELEPAARSGQKINVATEIARIVHRAVVHVFFGDRISAKETERVIRAIDVAGVSIGARLVMPSVPNWFPMPGDRPFRRAVRTIDDVIVPLVRASRSHTSDGDDIVSVLCRARDERGGLLGDRVVRDDVVSMLAAGTETTTTALIWLWVALESRPDVATRLYAEIDRVVGSGPVVASHLAGLRYTRMVLDELLRLYPVGWLIPRRALRRDVIDGHVIARGATVVVSPYLTHRLEDFWERPHVFDPERFGPEAAQQRHRFAYFPFGGGPHKCLGSHLFTVEAQIIIATILSRYRPKLCNERPVTPRPAASLRPRQQVEMVLRPVTSRTASLDHAA